MPTGTSGTGVVALERDDSGIAQLTLRDAAGRNALSVALVEQLTERLAELADDGQSRVCVLRGLPEVFCAGGSKDMLTALARGEVVPSDIMLSRAVLELPIPTIAAMEGHAVGGGLTLGLCCDIVLLARESRYGCSFMNMGFTPGMGTTQLLREAVGEYVAAEMMFGGEFIKGSRLEGRTQLNYVLPRDKVVRKALALAARIAEKPRHALELLKRSLSLRKRQLFEEARTSESLMHEICFSRPETLALIEEHYERSEGQE